MMYAHVRLRGGYAAASLALIAAGALLAPTAASAQTVGSSLTNRSNLDSSQAQVYIYIGGSFSTGAGFFASGATVSTFTSLDDSSFTNRYQTPILFEETSNGVYTVRGIGAGETVSTSATPQTFAFNVQAGTATTTSNKYTIGFINALVDTSGAQVAGKISAGTVDYSDPAAGGTGAGGTGSTNNWNFTPSTSGLNVGIGKTYYDPTIGGATGNYALYTSFRTYSAQAATAAPEPGSLALIALPLVGGIGTGLARRRRSAAAA